jgi:hypothetical protein
MWLRSLAGKEDLCSSILDPWHFMSISKKDSSETKIITNYVCGVLSFIIKTK